ncbi:MAG: radical SAM family heme chaperone HemW [Gammaproteobacteria bacterium]|nr:radical SAM family heme chaperone HemW [Gammaproteobacteria bacterium]
MFASLPPLTLYIHLPWCMRKCPYCDFNSHEIRGSIPEADYVDALLADLEQDLPGVWGRVCHAVFIGGGTPSLFSADSIDRLLSGVRARLPLAPEAEITLEANPGSSEAAAFSGFRAAGVNRLSIGVQSFNAAHLKAIGRIHDPDDAMAAVAAARQAGFENINLDLMFGLPGQTFPDAMSDAGTAVDSGPEHLSFYQLTLEPNTRFHRHPPELPEDEVTWEMQQQIGALLSANGYEQYEVSAYARPGRRCFHNLNYWRFGDYLGIGAGAHSKITAPDGIQRRTKVRSPGSYLRKSAGDDRIASSRRVGGDDAVFEFLLNALRLKEPVSVSMLQQRTGRTVAGIMDAVKQAERDGLIRMDGGALSTTDRGFRFLNELLERFLPNASSRTESA